MIAQFIQWCTVAEPTSLKHAKIIRIYSCVNQLWHYKQTRIGLIIILSFIMLAILAPILIPYAPDQQDLYGQLQVISKQHWFGTDELGRDIFSRVLYGTRYALYVVLLVTVVVVPLGISVGMIAGFAGGFVDKLLMRIIDIFLAFPKLILALAFVAALGPGINNAILAIIITSWAPYARLARAQTIALINSEFIWALKFQGASSFRILRHHLLPLCLQPIIIQASLDMSGFILAVAGLGFLGVGAQPPMPEWGAMIATGRQYILEQWWLITFPGFAIALISVGFNLLGDGLRDLFDPRFGNFDQR